MTPKSKNILGWVFVGLLAFVFTASGFTKLIGMEMQINNLESWGYPTWFRFPIGLSEVGIAIGLLVPKLRKFTLFGIFPWAIAAVVTHIQADQTNMIATPIVIAGFAFSTLWTLKSK